MPIRYIDITSHLSQSWETAKEAVRDSNDCAVKVRTISGWKSIDSKYNPRAEAVMYIGDEIGEGDAVLAVGIGSGYLLKELIDRRISRALLITASEELARMNLEQTSESHSNSEIILLAADSPEKVWQDYIESFIQNNPNIKVILHPREASVFHPFFGALRIKLSSFLYHIKYKPQKDIRNILFPGCGGLMERELKTELRSRGKRIIETAPFSDRNITPEEAWEIIHHYRPDLVLSVNNQGSDPGGLIVEACGEAGVPWASWYLDDPRFILSTDEISGIGVKRIGFCWDRNGIESWSRLRFTDAYALPLAVDPGVFYPGAGDDTLKGRIVFVGSPLFARTKGYFAALNEEPSTLKLAEIFETEIIKNRRAPEESDIAQILETENLKHRFTSESLRRLPAYLVQRANMNYRISILKGIADLNPVVFGAGWQGLLPDSVEVRGALDYYRDLPAIYRSDAVHLSITNLQMKSYPNQRIFDIGACGRIALNDALDGWDELFPSELNELVYNDIYDLRLKIIQLQKDTVKRKRLSEKLFDAVLSRHTIGHRVSRMLEIIDSY